MSLADYAAASRVLEPAAAADEVDEDIFDLYLDALLAAGEYDTLESILRPDPSEGSELVDWSQADLLVRLLAAQGRHYEAEKAVTQISELDAAIEGEETGLVTWLRAGYLYYIADWTGLEHHLGSSDLLSILGDRFAFWLEVEKNDVESAAGNLAEGGDPSEEALNQLMLSLLYARLGSIRARLHTPPSIEWRRAFRLVALAARGEDLDSIDRRGEGPPKPHFAPSLFMPQAGEVGRRSVTEAVVHRGVR